MESNSCSCSYSNMHSCSSSSSLSLSLSSMNSAYNSSFSTPNSAKVSKVANISSPANPNIPNILNNSNTKNIKNKNLKNTNANANANANTNTGTHTNINTNINTNTKSVSIAANLFCPVQNSVNDSRKTKFPLQLFNSIPETIDTIQNDQELDQDHNKDYVQVNSDNQIINQVQTKNTDEYEFENSTTSASSYTANITDEYNNNDNYNGDDEDENYNYNTLKMKPSSIQTVKSIQSIQTIHDSYTTMLPSEIIVHIMSFLSSNRDILNCLLTCKLWCKCVVKLLWFRPLIPNSQTLQLLTNTLSVTHSKEARIQTFDYASFIKRLNLSHVSNVVNDSILSSFKFCSSIERISFSNCSSITDEFLVPLLKSNPHLLSIDLSKVTKLTDVSVLAIAENCFYIQGLNLSECDRITDTSIIEIARKCPLIRRIKLCKCTALTASILPYFAQNCPHLLEIDLNGCSQISMPTNSLKDIFAGIPPLRELRLSNNTSLTDALFWLIQPKSPYENLRVLDLSCCELITDASLLSITTNIPRIRNLVLAKCSNITDRGVSYITQLGRNLHYLHLGHCVSITDQSINMLVRACTRIRYIDLACCSHLSNMALADLATLPKLRRVGMVKCTKITDEGIYYLINRQEVFSENSLERVHLSYCINLTRKCILDLLNKCPKLTHLSLTGISAFLHSSIVKFCREPPPDFTEHQQNVFCVFSGQGVKDLRIYLNELKLNNDTLSLSDSSDDGLANTEEEIMDDYAMDSIADELL